MPKFTQRLQHAWNAFFGRDHPRSYQEYGEGSYYRPDRIRLLTSNERSIVNAIYNRMAADVAAVTIQHVRVDGNGRYLETIDDGLNRCLSQEANIDQCGRAFIQDLAMTMFDEGCAAVVPVDTSFDPMISGSYSIDSVRVGRIVQWHPKHVRISLYNDATGRREEITLPKKIVAIVENPFYAIMNEPNSTLQRLIRKLNLLDVIDEQSGAGKLDLIIQLPYAVKSDMRRDQAERRRKDIEDQLAGSKYGIAYADSTERITQLNRSVNNNLMSQIEYLTSMLFGQLGLTAEIINGTANEMTMLNYNNRTIEPVLAAIADEFKRKFLTKTARTRGESIMYIRDPFRLVPINSIADIADKFTRNEILSSNELRTIIGIKPVKDERADELRNKNLNQSTEADTPVNTAEPSDGNPNETEAHTG